MKNTIWERATLIPRPTQVLGVKEPLCQLNSEDGIQWRFRGLNNEWQPIHVPGEVAMQGHDIENDTPYYYETAIKIPEDYKDKKIILRFNGVYSKAKVWVNNTYIRSHKGGFTTWDCDVTACVEVGKEAVVKVEFIDDICDPSIGSKYAHHNMGGILGRVQLMAVPKQYISRLHYKVDFDSTYQIAKLHITVGVENNLGRQVDKQVKVCFKLVDPHGQDVQLEEEACFFNSMEDEKEIIYTIINPKKWDAEHPNLYTLQASLCEDEQKTETIEVKVGLRKIIYGGKEGTNKKEVYVNGKPIKLRGTCRHNVHPTLGRTMTPEMDREDVILLKKQNINYVRTSHYPPTKEFLEACDELGMYVEEETAVNFQYANGSGPWLDDEEWYMDQLTEMIERDKSHACVLMWSLANESGWYEGKEGDKFRRQYAYVKQEDTTRPVKFSYPWEIKDGSLMDIHSIHYAQYNQDLDYKQEYKMPNVKEDTTEGMPVIHDEYAHIACYNLEELNRDNNVRSFWGESIYHFWEKIVRTPGALGGALWANIDDVFLLPEGVQERHQVHSKGTGAGYGQWGNMCDQWRREKPEYWCTKKAYSPIRLKDEPLNIEGNITLKLDIENWFNHTSLNEIKVKWYILKQGQVIEGGMIQGPDVEPFNTGKLMIPTRIWEPDEAIEIAFYDQNEWLIDKYLLPVQGTHKGKIQGASSPLAMIEDHKELVIYNEAIRLTYNKEEAQLTRASCNEEVILKNGPELNVTGLVLGKWEGKKLQVVNKTPECVEVILEGAYSCGLGVKFTQVVQQDGTLSTDYQILECKHEMQVAEIGIKYQMPTNIHSVEWERKGFYSVYPEDHIGRNKGIALRERENHKVVKDVYGERPKWEWKEDMRDFFLEDKDDETKGLVTRDFKAMREYIYNYQVNFENTNHKVQVYSDGEIATRIQYDYAKPEMINNTDETHLTYTGNWEKKWNWGCMNNSESVSNDKDASVQLAFYGTGVTLYYTKAKWCGKMQVKLDGEVVDQIDAWSDIGRDLHKQTYTISGLALGKHTLTIEAMEDNQEKYMQIDAFEVFNEELEKELQAYLIMNNYWNYRGLSWGNYGGEEVVLKAGIQEELKMQLFKG